MEEWRELARTVPDNLLRVAKGTIGVLGAVDSAHRQLAALVHAVRSLRRGDGDAINLDDVREQPSAVIILDDARRELARVLELYHMAKLVFVLYGTRLGPEAAHPLWQTWAGHGGETLGHGFRARESLRSAASHVRASWDALVMTQSRPPLSPDWTAWVSAALNLWRRAIWAATKASIEVRRMRDAVTVELEEACIVLNR